MFPRDNLGIIRRTHIKSIQEILSKFYPLHVITTRRSAGAVLCCCRMPVRLSVCLSDRHVTRRNCFKTAKRKIT